MVGVVVGAVVVFATVQPIKVLPRIRVGPGYALTDQHGRPYTSEVARGQVTVYSFAPIGCGNPCEDTFATLRDARDRAAREVDLDGTELRFVTIALADDPTPEELATAAEASGADGTGWRWIGGDGDAVRAVVGAGFRRYVDRADDGTMTVDGGVVVVDGRGVVRADNRYRTISEDDDKLVRQLRLLGEELRNAHGAGAAAYEAAHLFMCYG
ncbi:MAG: SCO family protein [Acidimicrobiales bacterium]